MKNNFDLALDYVFANEGGFSNHKLDRGGATKYGITRETLSRWRQTACSIGDVITLTEQEAKEIYAAWYWRPVGADKITHSGIATAMFDIAIVRGIGIPPVYAQEVCNHHYKNGYKLLVDGHVGPKTLAAINAMEPKIFINDFAAKARNGFLGIVAKRPSQSVFLKGWLNRAARLKTLA